VDRDTAYIVLIEHQPVTSWRGTTCRQCGARFPCEPHRQALDELAPERSNRAGYHAAWLP
jgi:hypothetical protein